MERKPVMHYAFKFCPLKKKNTISGTQLWTESKFSLQKNFLSHFRCSTEFSYQNLRQIGLGVPKLNMIGHGNKQKDITVITRKQWNRKTTL